MYSSRTHPVQKSSFNCLHRFQKERDNFNLFKLIPQSFHVISSSSISFYIFYLLTTHASWMKIHRQCRLKKKETNRLSACTSKFPHYSSSYVIGYILINNLLHLMKSTHLLQKSSLNRLDRFQKRETDIKLISSFLIFLCHHVIIN